MLSPLKVRAAQPLKIRTRVKNACARPFPKQATYGRRLVRLGAQLCDERGSLLERDYARAWLPDNLQPGARMDVPIEIVAPASPGRYTLKFDLVSEGIDWFEACGSPTTENGRRIVKTILEQWGVAPAELIQMDGSGLSRYDYVTADALVRILTRQEREPHWRRSASSSPSARESPDWWRSSAMQS